jgi:hypothetical protein
MGNQCAAEALSQLIAAAARVLDLAARGRRGSGVLVQANVHAALGAESSVSGPTKTSLPTSSADRLRRMHSSGIRHCASTTWLVSKSGFCGWSGEERGELGVELVHLGVELRALTHVGVEEGESLQQMPLGFGLIARSAGVLPGEP